MSKRFFGSFVNRCQISSKNFKPLWSLHSDQGTVKYPLSYDERLWDTGHNMDVVLGYSEIYHWVSTVDTVSYLVY